MESTNFKPEVTNYLSARLYLHDFYQWQKENIPDFSYTVWADKLGFKNKSLLRLIINGTRTITEASRKLLLNGLPLEDLDKNYFKTIALLDSSREEEERKKFSHTASKLLKLKHEQVEVKDQSFFLSSTKIPALQTLLSFKDVVATPHTLGLLLDENPLKIEEWLLRLEQAGLANKNESGDWKSTHDSWGVPPQYGNEVLNSYYGKCLEDASEALQFNPETRRYCTMLFALSPEEFLEFKEMESEFSIQVLTKFNHSKMKNRRLYQHTFGLHPISEFQDPILLENDDSDHESQ
ncbi:MAG: TIGR02147 family protein [Bdellovibrionota bacterium]